MMLLTPSLALALIVSRQLGLLIEGSELDATFPEGSADGLVSAVEIARQAEHLESDFLGCVCLGQELLVLAVDGLEKLVRYGFWATLRLLHFLRRTLSHSSLRTSGPRQSHLQGRLPTHCVKKSNIGAHVHPGVSTILL